MGYLPPYIFKLSLTLVIVYGVYWLLFRKLTFYTWNRWYLLAFSVLAFLIPLVDIGALFGGRHPEIIGYIPSLEGMVFNNPDAGGGLPAWMLSIHWFYYAVATGAVILLIRLFIQFISFRKLIRTADVIIDGNVRIYQVHASIVPFSFANSIFINAAQHREEELKEIIRHEFIHVKQRHSIDMMVSEILVMLNWYNPFAWLIRHSIRQNLEFIADEQVIRSGIDRKQYQYMLLKVVGISQFTIGSKFNFNSLKKRISMMNRNKTASVQLLRFAAILPLVAVSLVAFRSQQGKSEIRQSAVTVQDTVPVKKVQPQDIRSMNVNGKKITMELKDGTSESYDLNKPEEKAAFEKRYGKLPAPPPPPAPPAAPAAPDAPTLPEDIASIDIIKKDGVQKVSITKKDGKKETFDLTDPKQKADFESRYGEIDQLPPPPPPAPAPEIDAVAPVPPMPPTPPSKSNDPFFKKNPQVKRLFFHDDETLVITLKNGQKETYDLTDATQKQKVIEKYGSLPTPPPPPPVPPVPGE